MSNAYPAFRPYTYSEDGTPWFLYTKRFRKEEFSAPSGASALFFLNNAEPHNPNQFGLKLFGWEQEARAAYERQRLAAEAGLAPPVGRFVYVHDRKQARMRYFGYETGVAAPLAEEEKARVYEGTDDEYKGPIFLRRALRRIGLAGTIINDVKGLIGKSDERAPVNTRMVLGGDLHSFNVMRWQDRIVCIDFGLHSVLTSNRGPAKQAKRRFVY